MNNINSIQVSVIIVNYNTLKMTSECVGSVCEKTKDITFEIILIDNASKDGSKEFFEKDSRVRYVYSAENMGFGRANNVGMMLAKGEYIFLLNSDTVLVNNAIKEFYDCAKKHDINENTNFYGGWLLNVNGGQSKSYGNNETFSSMIKNLVNGYLYHFRKDNNSNDDISKQLEVDYVIGADLFFSRKIYDLYAGFDHEFFMYGEESDWQMRMKKYDIKSFIVPGPQIIHLEGQSGKIVSVKEGDQKQFSRSVFMLLHSRFLTVRRNYNFLLYILFRIIYFIVSLPMIFAPYTLSSKIKYFGALIYDKKEDELRVN